ncbi:MAG: hypothetical protein OD816_001296 [Thermodesulfobacterium sp.]|uniref:J domain-containing protein n=1 Tax=Candidatus Thermodesulfobacterium syntrophicum TaxID=3060442 RepID=A0AAE3P6E7_9BACT|nr:hypothetical protein [Candidatus Thermodesulfobacterium syntrophicum]
MREKKNPFEIFGLSPQIVKELDEEILFKLIKAIYKVFQFTYHPDRGGDSKKALEINLAFEKINLEKNPESFRSYRNKYIKRLSRKTLRTELEELRVQNRKLSFYNELLKEKLWQYLENGFVYLNNFFERHKGLKLRLFDMVTYMNFSGLRNAKKQMFFKDLIITKKYVLKRIGYEKYYRKFLNYKYIGCIKREYLEPWFLLERESKEENQKFKNFISKEVFIKECLIYLEPEIKINSYVFFYSPENFQKIILEGVVIECKEIGEDEVLNIFKNKVINFEEKARKLKSLGGGIVEF